MITLAATPGIEYADIITTAKKQVNARIESIKAAIDSLEMQSKKLEKMAKRVRRKDGKESLIAEAMLNQASKNRAQVVKVKEELKLPELIIGVLDDYFCQQDKPLSDQYKTMVAFEMAQLKPSGFKIW